MTDEKDRWEWQMRMTDEKDRWDLASDNTWTLELITLTALITASITRYRLQSIHYKGIDYSIDYSIDYKVSITKHRLQSIDYKASITRYRLQGIHYKGIDYSIDYNIDYNSSMLYWTGIPAQASKTDYRQISHREKQFTWTIHRSTNIDNHLNS